MDSSGLRVDRMLGAGPRPHNQACRSVPIRRSALLSMVMRKEQSYVCATSLQVLHCNACKHMHLSSACPLGMHCRITTNSQLFTRRLWYAKHLQEAGAARPPTSGGRRRLRPPRSQSRRAAGRRPARASCAARPRGRHTPGWSTPAPGSRLRGARQVRVYTGFLPCGCSAAVQQVEGRGPPAAACAC